MEPISARGVTIPENELTWRFDTSGGPGGQHANRSATRVELSWDVAESPSLSDDVRSRLLRRLGRNIRNGVVTVSAGDSRSQWSNRQAARRRLADLIDQALRPRTRRRATKPSGAARRARVESKRRRGELKRLRRRPEAD